MKTNDNLTKLIALAMSLMVFASCSSNDEPDNRLSGEEMVDHMESVLNSYLYDMYANETFDWYLLPVESRAKAREVAGEIIGEEWDGNDRTFHVPGDFGHIRMMPESEEGLYCTLVFDVVGLRHFTLQLCTPGYPESENVPHSTGHIRDTMNTSGYWYCYKCKKETTIDYKDKTCRKCGSKDVVYMAGGFR